MINVASTIITVVNSFTFDHICRLVVEESIFLGERLGLRCRLILRLLTCPLLIMNKSTTCVRLYWLKRWTLDWWLLSGFYMLCANGDFPVLNLYGQIHVTFINSIFNYERSLVSGCLQWGLITAWQLQQMMKACLQMIEAYSSFALLCSKTGPANLSSIILALINWLSIALVLPLVVSPSSKQICFRTTQTCSTGVYLANRVSKNRLRWSN